MKVQPGFKAALIAAALCAAFNSGAAWTAEAPVCTVAATNPSWADCAGAFESRGRFGDHPGGAVSDVVPANDRSFVLSLQGSNVFNLYDPDGAAAPVAGIDFTTSGLNADREGSSQGPLRASVYGAQMVASVPEPHTNALMLAGLAAIIAFMARRRRPR